MLWGEFKEWVESRGIKDDTYLIDINISEMNEMMDLRYYQDEVTGATGVIIFDINEDGTRTEKMQ